MSQNDSMQFAVPSPLEYFAALVADDASLALVEAAASIAQDAEPGLDVQAFLSDLDALAARLRQRVPADASELHRLRLLNHFFFGELGFAGNLNDYHNPENSYLHRVLATRRGIPISLAVLYMELATQLGLRARGVAFPGHFLVKMRMRAGEQFGEVIIDPFTGQSLARDDLDGLLQPYKVTQGLTGDFDAPLGLFLQTATPRDVLARMLRNLKEIHREALDTRRWLAVCERLVVLLPDVLDERRDLALVLAHVGEFVRARAFLTQYLDANPHADDGPGLRELLARWPSAEPWT
jgi:regulator of sirC expression with transglutaminase-like and TPR domain